MTRALITTALLLGVMGTCAGCAGPRHWHGAGEYAVRGPGAHILSGPYDTADACRAHQPAESHGETFVCIFLPHQL